MRSALARFDAGLEQLSRWGLVAALLAILVLAVGAIVLRWLGASPMWLEPLVRHLVFLSAFLGGSLATSKGVHIKIDLLTKLVEKSHRRWLKAAHQFVVGAFCLATTLFLMKASWDFYLVEKEFGAPAFLDIHSSLLVAIIPAGLGLIALRFLNQLLLGPARGEALESRRVH